MQNVVILGSTGSIGSNTLEVIKLHLDKYTVVALTANTNIVKLLTQCIEFKPKYAIILDSSKAILFQQQLRNNGLDTEVYTTVADLAKIVELDEVDIVMSAIVGSNGLLPTYNAICAGKKVLLANKESLVAAGKLINQALVENPKAQLIPVDSEHSAIFQVIPHGYTTYATSGVNRVILTASGGPFRSHSFKQLETVTADEALKHPNWNMGRKISIDSSTLMNKGLEVIEAYWLFGLPLSQIEVVVHPQSIIHSMVEYVDGSVLAQLGMPDMKIPISFALAYPKRITSNSSKLDFNTLSSLTFEQPDYKRFPCLDLAFIALREGMGAPAVLNAANEVAVEAFLENKIKFYMINKIIESTLQHFSGIDYTSVNEVIALDNEARIYASCLIKD